MQSPNYFPIFGVARKLGTKEPEVRGLVIGRGRVFSSYPAIMTDTEKLNLEHIYQHTKSDEIWMVWNKTEEDYYGGLLRRI